MYEGSFFVVDSALRVADILAARRETAGTVAWAR